MSAAAWFLGHKQKQNPGLKFLWPLGRVLVANNCLVSYLLVSWALHLIPGPALLECA